MNMNFAGHQKQKGAILMVSIIFLIVLAGLSIMILTVTESGKKTAHNDQDYLLAKQSAEVAIASSIQQLIDTWNIGIAECSAAPCTCSGGAPCVWDGSVFEGMDLTQQTAAWWNSYGSSLAKTNPELYAGAQYIIIDIGCDQVNSKNLFRIVSRGVGASQETIAFSDMTYSVPVSNDSVTTAGTAYVYGQLDGLFQSTFVMSPSTTSATFWDTGACSSGGHSAYCELNCVGQVRVVATNADSSNGCVKMYGPWSSGTSSIRVYDHPKNPVISCMTTNVVYCYNHHGKQKPCPFPGQH